MKKVPDVSGVMALGIRRLLDRYPLMGALIDSLKICVDASVPTMGVCMGQAAIELHYNPEFVSTLSLEELTGVLHHEARHIYYEHVFADPNDFPDEHARIVAEETTVNENLIEPLPGKPLRLQDYPELPPDETTLERYARLANGATRPDPGQNGIPAPAGAAGNPGDPDAVGAAGVSGNEPPAATPLDDHSQWESFRKNEAMAKTQIALAANTALQSGRELSDTEAPLMERLSETFGLAPGGALSKLDHTSPPHALNWRQILRQFIARASGPSYSLTYPSRRLPELLGIVPGRLRRSNRCRLVAAIDTSGSMSDAVLSDIARELTILAKRAQITVVEFDAQIQRVYPYRGRIANVQGRGGTDFRPVLKQEFWKPFRPDAVCIFTDGMGDAPAEAPKVPILWVLVPPGEPPVSWGKVAQMGGQA